MLKNYEKIAYTFIFVGRTQHNYDAPAEFSFKRRDMSFVNC